MDRLEPIAIALVALFAICTLLGGFVVCFSASLTVMHGMHAGVSQRSARWARSMGAINVTLGVVLLLSQLFSSGALSLGGVSNRLLLSVAGGIFLITGAFGVVRSLGRPAAAELDESSFRRTTQRAAVFAAIMALIILATVWLLAIVTDN